MNRRGESPLHYACLGRAAGIPGFEKEESCHSTWELINAGADPDLADKKGETPKKRARRLKHFETLAILKGSSPV